MKKSKLIKRLLIMFILIQIFCGSLYVSYAEEMQITFDPNLGLGINLDGWRSNLLGPYGIQSYHKNNNTTWYYDAMDYANNTNSLGHRSGWFPNSGQSAGKTSRVWMNVDLKNITELIDAGEVYYRAQVDFGNNAVAAGGSDTGRMIVTYYGSDGRAIDGHIKNLSAPNKTWSNDQSLGTTGPIKLPAGTKYIAYELRGFDNDDSVFGNGSLVMFSNPRLFLYDKVAPKVKKVTMTSPDRGTEVIDGKTTRILHAGDSMDFIVEFSEPVNIINKVTYEAKLKLETKFSDGTNVINGAATFTRQTMGIIQSDKKYIFHGKVPDDATDGMKLTLGNLVFVDLSTSVKDTYGNPISNLNTGLSGTPIRVDTYKPRILAVKSTTGNGTFRNGEVIEFSAEYSEPVISTGHKLVFNNSAVATYKSGSGTNKINYTYKVSSSDNIKNLKVTGTSGTLKDVTNKSLAWSTPSQSYSINIDTKSPDVAFTNSDKNLYDELLTYKKEHKVYITATDDVSGVKDIYYYWDNKNKVEDGFNWAEDAAIIANGTVPVVNLSGITGENYYLHFKVTDIAGNESIGTKGPFYFDNEKPTIGITPESGENKTSYDVKITSGDGKSGVSEIRYIWYRKTDESNSEQMSSGTVENDGIVTSPDMDGTYYITVESEDNSGNIQIETSGDYIVDKTSPTAVFSSDGNSNVAKTANIEVSVSDDSALNKVSYKWSESLIKPEANDLQWIEVFTEDSSNPTATYTGNISSGEDKTGMWYLHVRCEDSAGNIGIYTTGDGFNLDNENPDISFAPNGTASTQKNFSTTLEVKNESFGYAVKYQISKNSEYDESSLIEYVLGEDDITFAIDSETGSNETNTYYIHAKVVDTAGNISTLTSKAIYIDNTAPTGGASLNSNYTNQSPVQFMLSATDIHPEGTEENILMKISDDGGNTWSEWVPYSQGKNITLTEEKTYSIAVQYKDYAGNESQVYTANVVYDITKPEIDSISYNSEWTKSDLPVTITFTDVTETDDIVIELINDETAAEVVKNGNVITFKSNGICSFKYKDLAGNENTDSITISNFDKIAPEVFFSPDGNSDENKWAKVSVSATDNVTNAENIKMLYAWSQDNSAQPSNWTTLEEGTTEKSEGNGFWYLWVLAEDDLGNQNIVVSKGYYLDNEKPNVIDVVYNPNSATANNVTARVTFDENVRIISPVSTSEYANNFEYEFEDNGTEEIVFADRSGNENNTVLKVDWIDRNKPRANEVYIPDSWTNKSVEVTIFAEDANSSLYDFKVYVDDSRQLITTGSSTRTVAECAYNWNKDNGEYILDGSYGPVSTTTSGGTSINSQVSLIDVTVDGDGAVTQAKFRFSENAYMNYKIKRIDTLVSGDGEVTVDKIDTEEPNAVLTYTSKNSSWENEDDSIWTNEDVEVVLALSDNSGQPVEILNNGGSNKYTFEENGSFTFEIRDAAGNEKNVEASVDTIDKEGPDAVVMYSSGDKNWSSNDVEKWTNKDVEATLKLIDNSGESVEILNNSGINKYIFEENGNFIFKLRDKAGNESEITSKVSKIDREIPNPVISYNTQEWTHEDVVVSIDFDNEIGKVNILNNSGENSYEFSENGNFTFEFEDLAGNNGEITVVVNNIDKIVPTVDELWYSTISPTNGKVIAKVYASESVEFLSDNGLNSHTFEENGTHEFIFKDKAGNENSVIAEVNNIDRIPPNVWIEYSTTELTKDNVIATLKSNEEIYVVNNVNKNQYAFTENGTFTFRYEDLAGNGGEITATVENIDAGAPIITLEYSEIGPTQNDVTVTITSDKEITPVNYSGNTVVFTESGSKWLKVLDAFGDELYFQVEVNNIDKEAPEIKFLEGDNIVISKGSSLDYMSDVSVTDNLDEEISDKLNVTGNVDVETEGEYELLYEAIDEAGNSASVKRIISVVNSDEFTVFVNTIEAEETEVVTDGNYISLDVFGIEGESSVKWFKGKKSKGDFKDCETYCENGYLEIEESGYYTLLIQDQERNTKLLNIYVIHSN